MSRIHIFNWVFLLMVSLCFNACQQADRGLVVGKIQSASKLATTEFTVDKIVHGTKSKRLAWFIKLNEARFLAYSQAKIKTGINLKKLTKESIEIEGSRITVTLPPVEVINFSYPPSAFKIDKRITDTVNFLNKISIADQEEFFRMAEVDIRNNLKYMGIVETTQTKTITLLKGMLKALGYEEIYILFESDELIVDEVHFGNEEKETSN